MNAFRSHNDKDLLPNAQVNSKGKFFWFKIIDEQLIWILLLLLFLITTAIIPKFFSLQNIQNLALNSSILGILVIAETLCLLVGKFDLSIESTLAITALIGAIMTNKMGFNPILTWVVVLLLGAVIGLFNGVLIVKVGVNPFVQTLSMMIILRGLMLVFTGGITVFPLPQIYRAFGATKILTVPTPIIILVLLYVFFIVVLEKRQIGRFIYATGSNSEAAYTSGVNVNKINILVFTLSGLIAAFAGLVLSGRLNAVDNNLAKGMVFEVMAASVIGGISLAGGRGRLLGALGGVLFLGMVGSVLTWLNVQPFMVETVRGIIILVAVVIDAVKNKVREKLLMI
ncbi:MAG: ABC transporter permease [Candidatus Humimicrobiaceae bacterium]